MMGDVTPINRRRPRSGVAFEPAPAPETVLSGLFKQEAELEAGLRMVRAKLSLARRLYADKHGLLVLPSIEHFRQRFGS